MLPSRQPAGPFGRCIREALESAVSPVAATNILAEALKRASLRSVPEDSVAFRDFCEGPFRSVTWSAMGEHAPQVFERLGHILRMVTSDAHASPSERKSGTHPSPAADATPANEARESGPILRRPELRSPSPLPPAPTPRMTRVRSVSPTATTLGAMPAVRSSPTDRRVPITIDPPGASPTTSRFAPLPPLPTPVRARSSPPTGSARTPSAVLLVTRDPQLIATVARDLAAYCPVFPITTDGGLAEAARALGERFVVVIDTALPSIDVPTFAGLSPLLPHGAHVVLWGIAPRELQRLVTLFPAAAGWIASGAAPHVGAFVRELGDRAERA